MIRLAGAPCCATRSAAGNARKSCRIAHGLLGCNLRTASSTLYPFALDRRGCDDERFADAGNVDAFVEHLLCEQHLIAAILERRECLVE